MKLNGTDVPKKVLDNHWDKLIDKNCIINGFKRAKLLGFKANGRVIFKDKNQFIMDINDIEDLHQGLNIKSALYLGEELILLSFP